MMIKKIVLICPHDNRIPLQVTSYRAFMPRYGLLIVAVALREQGYEVETFCEFSGSRIAWESVAAADAVCFSLMSFSALKGYAYADRVRAVNPRAVVIFGGSHPSVLPEDCLEHCDYAVRNEGESSIIELLETLSSGGDVSGVLGISFKDSGGMPRHNPSRPFIGELNRIADPGVVTGYSARTLPFYLKDLCTNGVPRFNIAVVQASRGCPQGCRFCFVKHELGMKYRTRDPQLVIREIETSLDTLRTRYVFFADNDLAHDRQHALELFRLMEKRFRGNLDLFFFSRIFMARDEELMHAVERAGRACIGVGVESLDPGVLNFFSKHQTVEDINANLELFRRYKVKLQLLFIFGADHDTMDTLERSLELVLRHGVYNWGFCSMYDFPTRGRVLGVPQILPDHRFIHRDWRFYSGNFVVHYPAKMRPSALQRGMSSLYRRFYAANRNAFYQYHPIQATFKYYIPLLEQAEKGLYDSEGMLREDRLPGPLADRRQVDVAFSRLSLAGELARFYFFNMARPQSWRYLLSIGKKP